MNTSKITRRERCRRNQQRYRDRQAQRIKDLEHQVSGLKDALRDRPNSARATSGSSIDMPPSGTQPSLPAGSTPHETIRRHISYIMQAPGIKIAEQEDHLVDVGPSPDGVRDIAAVSNGRFSPRLTYSVLGSISPDHKLKLNIPPLDIVPFLATAPDNIAKILFWRAMATSFRTGRETLQEYREDGQTRRLIKPGILTLPFLVDGAERVLKRLDFRLSFVQDRVVEDDTGRDNEDAIRMRYTIERYLEQHKVPLDEFLDPEEVQTLLLDWLGVEKVTTLQKAATGPIADAKSLASNSWVEQLASRAVCLRSGPRWRHRVVVEAIQDSVHLA